MIFAFFGYNESFAGVEGLAMFRGQLDAFIKHTVDKKYNGTVAAAAGAVFADRARRPARRNLPDGAANNAAAETLHGRDGRDRGQ